MNAADLIPILIPIVDKRNERAARARKLLDDTLDDGSKCSDCEFSYSRRGDRETPEELGCEVDDKWAPKTCPVVAELLDERDFSCAD